MIKNRKGLGIDGCRRQAFIVPVVFILYSYVSALSSIVCSGVSTHDPGWGSLIQFVQAHYPQAQLCKASVYSNYAIREHSKGQREYWQIILVQVEIKFESNVLPPTKTFVVCG